MKLLPVITHVSALLFGAAAFVLIVPSTHEVKTVTVQSTPKPVTTFDPAHTTMTKDTLLIKINDERIVAKVPQLFYEQNLQSFADARLMTLKSNCAHDTAAQSAQAIKLHIVLSENYVCNAHTTDEAMSAWEGSPTHKAAMLDGQYSHITISTDGTNAITLFSTAPYME